MGVPHNPDPQPKVPVVRRSAYTLYLEQATKGETFIHCDIHAPWGPQVCRKLRADFETLLDLHGGPIRALHTPGDRKHLKFLTMFGFHKVAEYISREEQLTEIYST